MKLEQQIEKNYGLKDVSCRHLDTLVNEVFEITATTGKFALKLYLPKSRGASDVQWELDLTRHLVERGAPVAQPIRGLRGYVESFNIGGETWAAALFEWAPGAKPTPELSTYILLGRAAALIHAAADSFSSPLPRESNDADALITQQLGLMKPYLTDVGRWEEVDMLGDRLLQAIASSTLDWGINHMDLTLDNVHRDGDALTVFDFDSAAESWRALEPYGVLRASAERFQKWLEGYRSIRPFSEENEKAVGAFAVIGDLSNVVWKLGLAKSSRGKPLLAPADLPEVVDEWLELEKPLAQ